MSALLLTILSAMFGIVATIIVSKYFFRKTIAKDLTPYVQFASPIFAGIDPEVKDQLKVFFRDVEVEDLYELQFVVVNTGERAIRDCIEPLALTLPSGVSVLDVAILHVHPEGRSVQIASEQFSEDQVRISFPFALLNKNEGFVVKALLRGAITRNDLRFSIVTDDLPPVLAPQPVAPPYKHRPRAHDLPIAITGTALFTLLALSSVSGMILLIQARPELFPYPWKTFSPQMFPSMVLISWVLCTILMIAIAVSGVAKIISARKARTALPLPLPSHLRNAAGWLPHELFADDEEEK